MSPPVQRNCCTILVDHFEVSADSFQSNPVLIAGPCHLLADASGRNQKIWSVPFKTVQPCCQSSDSTSFFFVHFRALNHRRSLLTRFPARENVATELHGFQLQLRNDPLCVLLIWLVLQSCSCPTDDSIENSNFCRLSSTRS